MSDNSKSKRGGARPGAGRKKGSSVYGESTKAIRVPESMISEVKAMLALRIKFAHQNLILKPSHPGPLQQERGIKTRNEHKQQFESMDSDSPGSTHLLNSLNSADSFSAADLSTLSFPPESLSHLSIPLFTGKVAAGFPSPADDYIEKTLDLNDLLFFCTRRRGVDAGRRHSSQ
jgi:DNA polymerase V